MKTEKILVILALFVVMLIALSSVSPDFFKGFTTGSVVTGVSTINYQPNTGEVKSGYLYGSKMLINAKLDNSPIEMLYKYAGTEQIWGSYKIKPQNNVLIKMSAINTANSSLLEYRLSYYNGFFSGLLQTKSMKGATGEWRFRTPIHIEIYADSKPIPTTPILIKDITYQDFTGQQFLTLGNNINIQRTSVSFLDTTLPTADNIVVDTAPIFDAFQSAMPEAGYTSKSYIFDRPLYASRVDYFYKYTGDTLLGLNDPLLVLWTGYDKYSLTGTNACSYIGSGTMGLIYVQNKGYCKLVGWNGLYKEVPQVSSGIKYNPITQNIIKDPADFLVDVNFELPSETIGSFAILRGAGIPIITFSYPVSLSQGTQKYLDVNVKNIGDSDTFNIVPTSKSGKLIFTPSSLSAYINTGETKTFKFVTGITGQETSLASATESTEILVTPQHNLEARVTESFSTSITYKVTSETSPDTAPTSKPPADIRPSDADTMDLNQPIQNPPTVQKWYENPWFGIGLIITIISGLYYLSTKKK